MSGKELFIRFTASAFRKLLSIYVFSYFPFGFEGRMWDLIVSVPDHCLSYYYVEISCTVFPAWVHKSYWNRHINSDQHKYMLQVRRKIALDKLKRIRRPLDTAMFRNVEVSRDTENPQSNEMLVSQFELFL